MTSKADGDLDAALSALAREVGAAPPRPGPALTAAVLADAAVATLAREVDAGAPRPSDTLVARVLADAATVAAERPQRPAPQAGRVRGAAARPPKLSKWALSKWLFGWKGGAVAAMVLGLAVGVGLGLEAGPGALPLLDAADADPFSLAAADSAMPFAEGL